MRPAAHHRRAKARGYDYASNKAERVSLRKRQGGAGIITQATKRSGYVILYQHYIIYEYIYYVTVVRGETR